MWFNCGRGFVFIFSFWQIFYWKQFQKIMLFVTFISFQITINKNSEIPRKNEYFDDHGMNTTLTRSSGCIPWWILNNHGIFLQSRDEYNPRKGMGKYPGMEMKENVRQNEKYFLRRVEHSKFPLRTVRWRTVFLAKGYPRTDILYPF